MSIMEMIERVTVADSKTKGYKFHCSNTPRTCEDCGRELMGFVTQDIEEAYQHSNRNSVAMWISKD